MKASEQYFNFPLVLFIMLYKVVLTSVSGDKNQCVTIPVNYTEQNLTVIC